MKENVIEINHLTKNYGKSRGVIDVSLTVKKGDIFGFLGPNGAGSTVFHRARAIATRIIRLSVAMLQYYALAPSMELMGPERVTFSHL